ncbi:dephospho-CoA kinase [Alkalilimnicola sp. S0819]|uniref:dephospho-CoA kinase n=1 Tax=Alkalilimnicola sp. S0819 TaxID=2613922 RepID=UPI0012621436|nr:dephospho-CoA kinase [Alkalilimnicola sp. S0819]KAB7623132.1 dephospho-CoA kinase [Alkalilimnicola sp. S0819]MPQ16976.1 dephospho-CoA kinase [Alkalilimnicola sp. S0819]
MLVVALTGGIASGKTTVSDRFAALGVPVVDADVAAREVVAPGQPGLEGIRQAFGESMLDNRGRLDRARLREHIFQHPEARARLNALLHPLIRERLRGQLRALHAPYALLVIPLLVETGMQGLADRVLVVDAPRETQRQRLMARDGGSAELAEAMLAAQAERGARLAIADDVIVNDSDLKRLQADVEALHQAYLRLAGD